MAASYWNIPELERRARREMGLRLARELQRRVGLMVEYLGRSHSDPARHENASAGASRALSALLAPSNGKSIIARLTKTRVTELLTRNEKSSPDRLVATYGGAMHNDLTPPPERALWSFGPDLSARVKGRYVEVDLFVPEFILETESWKKLEWYPHFDRTRHADRTTLFNPHPGSYVLIFPRTPR